MRKQFERFMRLNGWWDDFINNTKDIDIFFQENDPCDYLSAAFNFEDSAPGCKFWEYVQSKWDEQLRNERILDKPV